MRARFWGTRGSIPTPGPGTVRYGGNTSCVEVRTDAGELLVLDCGTGARALGASLVQDSLASGRPLRGSILIGHTHWDHIHGLPFFAPLFVEGSSWDVYGPRGLVRTLDNVLAGQMEYQYFPVGLDEVAADVRYHDLVEGDFEIGDARITTQYLNHPALTLGFRIEADGATLVYATDHELHDGDLAGGGAPAPGSADAHHAELLAGADVVIHDAQYDAASYAAKAGWGHSTMEYAVDVCGAANVGRLILFHHDPARDDDGVDALLAEARGRGAVHGLEVDAAAEGTSLEIAPFAPRDEARRSSPAAALRSAVLDVDATVVVATRDEALREKVATAAGAEGLRVVDRDEASDTDLEGAVIVVDLDDDSAGSWAGTRSVIGATRRALPRTPSAVTDWLVLPCSIAHVRTKLRAAVLRRACRWVAAPVPPDEEARVAALHELAVLDTAPEERFDRIVEQARQATATPIALVTLVDAERQWFKAQAGFPATESHRDESICAHAILADDVFQVPDLLEDDRFAHNPAVAGPARIRFYAGVPLTLADGSRVGTLCVGDHRPRLLDDEQLAALRTLAAAVVEELETPAP